MASVELQSNLLLAKEEGINVRNEASWKQTLNRETAPYQYGRTIYV